MFFGFQVLSFAVDFLSFFLGGGVGLFLSSEV